MKYAPQEIPLGDAWIDGQRGAYPMPALCATLGVSPSGYQAWKRGGTANWKGGVPPSGVRAEGVGFAVGALQGPHGGRDQEVIGELR